MRTILRRAWSRARDRDERGYVIMMSALLILPLMAFAGFATDIGAWYSQAAKMQRAADAAALAGVPYLPDLSRATDEAERAAERNGFVDGVDDITIDVHQVGPHQLNVLINDASVDLFFASLVIERVEITRTATAEYVLPLAMGSPNNAFGNEGLGPYAGRPNFYAAVSGPRTQRSQGDYISTRCDLSNQWDSCQTWNPTFDPDGYFYAIDIPPGASGVDIELFDAGWQERGSLTTETGDSTYGVGPVGANGVSTHFQMYNTDLTPLTHLDNPTMSSAECETGPASEWIDATSPIGINGWTTLCHITAPTPGIYPLQVHSYDKGYATNQFSIRATSATAIQPRVYGIGKMSIFAEADAGSAEFYLAEIPETNRGKTLRVELFDPGESTGAADLTVLGPGGSAVDCEVRVDSGSPSAYSPCTITTTDGSGTPLFNGKLLRIEIDLDPSYTCTPDCWWKVDYAFTAKAHDRTVWSASIVGDPVHLVRTGG